MEYIDLNSRLKLLSKNQRLFSMKNQKNSPENCPRCGKKLHKGEHKFSDGGYNVIYCKSCGFRQETPI